MEFLRKNTKNTKIKKNQGGGGGGGGGGDYYLLFGTGEYDETGKSY